MKKKKLSYGKYTYKYNLVKEDRKSLSLTINPNLSIVVRSPYSLVDENIEKFLKRRWLWIDRKLKFFRKYSRTIYIKEYVSGESLFYLGRQYLLKVKQERFNSISLSKTRIYLSTINNPRDSGYNQKLIESWYKKETKDILEERYRSVCSKFIYKKFPEITIRKMKKRWGSFVNHEKIILNPKLIEVSTDCIDYVIIHELCHLKYKNHSKDYFQYLDLKYPEWKKAKKKLDLKNLNV